MSNQEKIKLAIQSIIISMMDKVMDNVLLKDPFIPETHRTNKPLYAALVPDEIFKGSHFERRFTTPFGKAWEKLAMAVAQESLGHAELGRNLYGNVKAERLRRITEVLNRLEHKSLGGEKIKPDWVSELFYIMAGDGEDIPVSVVCDLYTVNIQTNYRCAFEIKAPLPNSDQTKVSKEKILKLYAMEPRLIDDAYFALAYNPYGKKENYGWSVPSRWFNMKTDSSVLIGNEFWDKIGGDGTYQVFIEAVNEIGAEYKERIYHDFLGIAVPYHTDFKLGIDD